MRLAWTVLALVPLAASTSWADKKLDQAVAKAEAQLAKGKEAEAVKILEKAVAQAPRDPEAPLALMTLFTRLGRREEAAAALATAGERARNAPPAVRARVRTIQSEVALREGTAGDALDFAREAVEAAAGPESLVALARAQARMGLAAARETAERAARAAPDSAPVHVARGDALLAARLDAEAAAAYQRAVDIDPRSVAGRTGLALALVAQGEGGRALEAARAATEADPKAVEAQAALGLALLAQDPGDKKGEAVAAAHQAAFQEPKSPFAALALGRVLESRGQLEPAATAYGEARALDPSWPSPPVAALGIRMRRGDADGALAALRALPEEFRTTGEAELLLGRILTQKEEWTGAVAAFERAAALLPGLAEAQALQGDAAYNAGELKVAAEAYGRAVELDPRNRAYRSSHALYLGYDGRREEALSALLEVTAAPDGQTPDAFMKLGGIYRGFRPPRVSEAVAAYERALKLDPKNGQAALGVARSYRAGRQWARAITAYERIADAFPRLERDALLGSAWCYYLSGDDTRARFYTGLAAHAGADVGAIRQAFSRPAAGAIDDVDRTELAEGLRSKNAGAQARAVKSLLELGRPAVPSLAAALQREGTSLPARELIVDGLASLGPAAREALPQLDRLAAVAPPPPKPGESDNEKALREREARLAASARTAADRIRSRGAETP
jgi:tetratricopeptide (TPR) repeat protein